VSTPRARWSVLGVVLALGLGGGLLLARSRLHPPPIGVEPAPADTIAAVSPTLVSNQTSYPLTIFGRGFAPGDVVRFSGAFELRLPAAFIDSGHLAVRLPPQPLAAKVESVLARVTVEHRSGTRLSGEASLTVVNDSSFAQPYACALSPDGRTLFVASPTTDTVDRYATDTGERQTLHVGDGPRALAVTADGATLVVADELASALERIPLAGGATTRIPLDGWPQELQLDGATAWVTTRQGGLLRVDLPSGRVERTALPGRQPRALTVAQDGIYVAQLGTDDVVHVRPSVATTRIAPGPGVRIVGGRTEKYGPNVMGGKAARALVHDPVHQLVFASTIGPNVGPNPDCVEVSMNGGVEVIDARTDAVVLHLGLGAGVLEGLAIDPAAQRLYAADLALGRVLAFDTGAFTTRPAQALLGELKISPPAGTPRVRPDADLSVHGRSGPEIHSGPRALCLDAPHRKLYAVNRLSGTVSVIDVSDARHLALVKTFDGPEMWNQRERRLGEVLYFSDLGRSGMSCDACHLEGHTSGVLYEKTHPLRIYRVSTLRGIRDSPPYFTPSALPTLEVVSRDVLGRNRFHNPDPDPDEIHWLSDYQALLLAPPNPNVGVDAAPRRDLLLPDGKRGDAIHGQQLFESAQVGCSASRCHPGPTFSADQDPATRSHFADVGTPVILPLHPELQQQIWKGWPPPPLVGTWDVFPLLQSGAGGLGVKDGSVVPVDAFPHRALLLPHAGAAHGNTAALSETDRDDLLAYLMSI
jgi:DNA-binding beta-propeller fold protein YncE